MALDATRYPVLVIEDDEATGILYEKYLRGSGFQVVIARNLAEARRGLAAFTPVAIVLDILLKGEEGWAFISELKSDKRSRDIPVLIASVLDDRERGIALGAEDLATKPIDRAWLLARLKALTRRGSVETVLVVDDDEVARYIMKGTLTETKYQVLEASGGEQALRIARDRHPDLIFLDLMMPGMDGFETLSRLKASPDTRDIPVIVVSSKLLDEEERRNLRERTLALISKDATSREAAIAKIRDAVQKLKAERVDGGLHHGD